MRSILVIGLLAALVTANAWPQCQTPEHRQFDFWVGDWDAYDLSDTAKAVARIQVTSIMDGCALREVYVQKDGLNGESFSLWDASRGRWHQSWVTNRGALLLLEGRLEGDGKTGRHIKLRSLDELPREAVRGWLRAAVALAQG